VHIQLTASQTARLSLEEINEVFGDRTVINLTNATEEEKKRIDETIKEKDTHVTYTEQL
jgi:hypothetical protein